MILESGSDSTEHTYMFGKGRWPGVPHRVLKTPFFETWKNKMAADETEFGQPTLGRTTMFENVSRFAQLLKISQNSKSALLPEVDSACIIT